MRMKQEERKFIELVERLMERWGYDRTGGKIYAILLLSSKPLTISELTKITGLSRSSVSMALSKLSREYLVTYTKEKKTKYFYAVPAFLEKFLQQPKEILEREIKPLKEIVIKLSENSNEDEKSRFKDILSDLSTLECVLKKIIELEEKESECLKR
ncbi:GbsR/MarR family transcriptional regulator [Pyrococcus horikoshii]|nr:GbsR/MarR family transcriptional regulator [Pyrococcus horikoshii]HII61314.1 GbsR/MarR family transcriptional regulator [Pyrococcus horikoshii]